MANPDDGHKIVEGDGSKVPVQIAPGDASDSPRRPAKGAQLVWGGSDPSSPWGHLLSLIEAGGGSVQYTLLHSSVLAQLAQGKKPKPPANQQPKEKQAEEPADEKQHEKNLSYQEGAPTGGAHEIFGDGHDFEYDNKNNKDARVWAHPAVAGAGKVPLLVFLHGIAATQDMDCNFPQLQNDLRKHSFACHLGRLAKSLVDGGKVRPLAIAAPTAHDNKSSTRLWRVFDLAKFVQRVVEEAKAAGVEIDLDEVMVAGHSGAGCDASNGLYKVAKEHARFQAPDGSSRELRVLGFADTCARNALARIAADGLKGDEKTAIYVTFQGDGGGGPGTRDRAGSKNGSYEEGYGCTKPKERASGDPEAPAEHDEFVWNGKDPGRYALHFSAPDAVRSIFAHEGEWIAAGAVQKAWPKTGDGSGWAKHYGMTLVWTWYALQRFWPARAEDQRLLEQHEKKSQADEHGEAEPARDAAPPPGRPGPDWESVPKGPPAWHAPAARPRSNPPARFADPISGRFWPVRTRSSYGRAVAFIGEDGHGYGGGPASDPTAQRHFLATRQVDDERWYNGGVDLYADFGDTVVATEEGTIIRFEPLYSGVDKLLVRCTSGLVVHYGAVDPDSLESLGLKVGDLVRAGQPIARVGRMDGSQPMLEFDTYPAGTKDIAACLGTGNLASFLDPTAYLLNLAVHGQ
jgi:murein DD-endopeptidase MepM/ murein hydrolase activator NlpD